MDRYFALPSLSRTRLCVETAGRLGIPAVAVEKDFWVCWILRELVVLPQHGEHLVFKGGTSLAKGWRLIARFSEDVDLVVDRAHLGFTAVEPSRGQIKKLRRRCREWIRESLRPALAKRIAERLSSADPWRLDLASEMDDPDGETLIFEYPRLELPGSTYLKPFIRIELGARSDAEPVERIVIRPYFAEEFSERFPGSGTSIRTLAARRTLLEKTLLLHEERQRPAERPVPARFSRHYYDLWCLARSPVAGEAMADFDLFARVARQRALFWRQSWVDYSTLCRGQLRLGPEASRLQAWRLDYRAMREMIFGDVPTFDEILAEVARFEAALNATSSSDPQP